MTKRINLVMASGLSSSYMKKSKPNERLDVSAFKENAQICPDMFDALNKLNQMISDQNGTMYITDLLRTWDGQSKLRSDYENNKHAAYAAAPGGSFHQAGRAVDFDVQNLNFKDIPKENWLQKFWDLAKPLGFSPIVKIPDLSLSECWHFDFMGPWRSVYEKLDYTCAAKCAILDVGCWDPATEQEKTKKMFCQAQLLRIGFYEIKTVDGIFGSKTLSILKKMILDNVSLDNLCETLKDRT